jgi:hypothetical protein
MNIDRHNYEEYFLLYIDNELNVDQKKQVEAFVSANPDLEEEFVMLQQSCLVPDDSIVFEGKEMLMKKESGPITINNYEQWLVLYVDNELTEEEKIAVEKFADSTPTVRAELNLFLQTKLEPKEIVFPGKESLYRTDVKVRVISMRWLRVAAVIAFLLATGFGIYSIFSNTNNPKNNRTANNQNVTVPNNSLKSTTVEPGNQTANKTQNESKDQNTIPSTSPQQQQLAVDQQNQNQKTSVKKQVTPTEEKYIAKQPQPEQMIAKVVPTEVTGINGSEATKDDVKTIESTDNPNNAVAKITPTQQKITSGNNDVTKQGDQTLNIKEAGTLTDDVAESNGNKKLRGIFRRATRFIERTTKMNPADTDGKVLIGAVAVSLK